MSEFRNLEQRYGVIIAEAVTEEIRKAEDGRVIYFAGTARDIDETFLADALKLAA